MASSKDVSEEIIEQFFMKYLLRKPLPIIYGFHFPFVVRSSQNGPGEVFRNIDRCSYNPNEDQIKLQRCNYKRQQIFYAAVPADGKEVSAQMTALLETAFENAKRKKVNRCYYTLSRWIVTRPLIVLVLPFSNSACRKNNDFKEINAEFHRILKDLCGSDDYLYKYFLEFLACISSFFCMNRKKKVYYKITSAFFNSAIKLFNKEQPQPLDGIVYPSANTRAGGMNIALRKEVVDKKEIICDIAVMQAMLRNPSNPKDITFPVSSNETCPDSLGRLKFHTIF